MIDDE